MLDLNAGLLSNFDLRSSEHGRIGRTLDRFMTLTTCYAECGPRTKTTRYTYTIYTGENDSLLCTVYLLAISRCKKDRGNIMR